MLKVIDLFAGCGGFSLGFKQNKFEIIKAVEFDKSIANSYKQNHPNTKMYVEDIKNISNKKYFSYGEADVIIGGPPCQGFSMAGARNRGGFIDDPRNYLFKNYYQIVKIVKPKVFFMENVKGLISMQNGLILQEIISLFQKLGYSIFYRVIKAVEYGIPQKRERVILIGVNNKDYNIQKKWEDFELKMRKSNSDFFSTVNISMAIRNLPLSTKDGKVLNTLPTNNYEKFIHSVSSQFIYNHNASKHSKIVLERINKIKKGENYTSLNEDIKSIHSGAYGRLKWDDQSPTITTRFDTPAGGRFIHPTENRTITPREAARLQSFPDSFIFYGTKTSICKQIGNAVPPKISFFLSCLAKSILEDLK